MFHHQTKRLSYFILHATYRECVNLHTFSWVLVLSQRKFCGAHNCEKGLGTTEIKCFVSRSLSV